MAKNQTSQYSYVLCNLGQDVSKGVLISQPSGCFVFAITARETETQFVHTYSYTYYQRHEMVAIGT